MVRGPGDGVVTQEHCVARSRPASVGTTSSVSISVEDDRHQGPNVLDAGSLSVEVADGGSLERADCGGRLPWSHRRCWWCHQCWRSRMRWKWCSDIKDVGELELEGSRSSSCPLGLEGSSEVDQSGGGS
jgi:hypothetical protein